MPYYVLFDTETTGNSEEDRIIQFGGIIVNQKSEIETYDEFCSSTIDIKLEAMEVNNITPVLLEDKPLAIETTFYKRLQELNTNENFLIAHNISFDMSMIEKEGFQNQYKLIDTLRCAKHLYPELPYHRLQYIRYALELYKKEQEEAHKYNITIKAHDAIGDVLIMKLFLSKLVTKCRELYPKDNPIEKLVEFTKTPVLIKIFKFGKYKGQEIVKIANEDPSYLKWMKTNMDLDEDLQYTFNKVLNEESMQII